MAPTIEPISAPTAKLSPFSLGGVLVGDDAGNDAEASVVDDVGTGVKIDAVDEIQSLGPANKHLSIL